MNIVPAVCLIRGKNLQDDLTKYAFHKRLGLLLSQARLVLPCRCSHAPLVDEQLQGMRSGRRESEQGMLGRSCITYYAKSEKK
jgi:hypothetical protein